ncbi:Alcohol dehydrogenase GroES domain protein [Halothece sp. PCC 7418]|uniref:alcohol dehydrogenase AdhP n=1 Tax=Halothece sp. (strain PCC 7418) TaxID=65093 RepID=UPI0002A08B7A|nr:alcohol dehydrogenase AdhP [Halothece sp. PCC 7418]AFZ45088.1 Alcohol dehydrogenase GroES domain protein [Halothece sp. PCC 7418]
MANTMKAAIAEEFGKPLQLKEVEIPQPQAEQVLVKLAVSGVCHTDVHAADGDWPVKPNIPFIPGHEGVGHVAEVGSHVTHLEKGDHVGIPWLHTACSRCEYCVTGQENFCPTQENTGYSVNGTFAEYVLADANHATKIPQPLESTDAAPILCAGVTTYRGLKETHTKPGDWVVISGIGGLGHLAVQYAKAMGLRVIALSRTPKKLELAQELGADKTINVSETDPGQAVQDQIGGAHGALVTAVSTQAFHQAVSTLQRSGTCSMVGLPPGEFPLSIFEVILKGIDIQGSLVGTRADLREALQFAAEGHVKPAIETQPLEAVNATMERLKKGEVNGRVVLTMS